MPFDLCLFVDNDNRQVNYKFGLISYLLTILTNTCHHIVEILLKVALNTINPNLLQIHVSSRWYSVYFYLHESEKWGRNIYMYKYLYHDQNRKQNTSY